VTLPKVGGAAPAFSAEDETGATVTLSEQKGSWIVLFFYPKDDTPG
jgi:thioredoxin-dependent peroxiredoxin